MKPDPLLEKLKKEIVADLRPQKPLAASWKRALLLLPLWLILMVFVLAVFGLRSDYETLGAWGSWGLTVVQLAAAYGLIWVGLQLVIPGSGYATGTVAFLGLLALGVHFLVAGFTFRLSPVWVPVEREWALALICFLVIFFLGVIPLALASSLAARGLTWLPALVGGVCGLGAGLAGEAVWRMHCSITSWDHVLPSHTTAVFGTMVLGVLAGIFWQLRQLKSPD
jgi:hypothetical protein